jgi:putative hydrolase of the HAD superfamily
MRKKAIIYDLDNTLYPVSAIGEKLFRSVFNLIAETVQDREKMAAIKKEMMQTPFRIVANKHNLSDELIAKAIAIQEDITFEEPIATFEDYPEINLISTEKFLVTTGFRKMQLSKIKQMGIEADFKEIHIVDPTKSSKKEVFADIILRYGYRPDDVLVIGDDPESEIKAAKELGIQTVLYDKSGKQDTTAADFSIKSFTELSRILK